MIRSSSVGMALVGMLGLGLCLDSTPTSVAGQNQGQPQASGQVGSAQTQAPEVALQQAGFSPAAMASPLAESVINNKQQRLRDHHISVPIPPAPAGAQALVPAAADTASFPATSLSQVSGPNATTLQLLVNRPLTNAETHQNTSTVCEPSVAVRGHGGKEILLTGNWFAVFSKDSGSSFQFINPATTFPASSQGPGFCCDQVALYDPVNDVMLWLLQYIKQPSGPKAGNTLRLAVARGNDIPAQNWRYYDFSPQSVGNWANEWFDFPNLVLGQNNLYLTSNTFSTDADAFKRSVVLRIPLNQLAAYQALNYNFYNDQNFSPRCTHGATTVMYWATHINLATMRVYTWPENSGTVQGTNVTVQTWVNATRVAPGPDGRDWMGRADGRITAAWASGGNIGFAWSASQGGTFPFPHVRVAILDQNTKAVVAQPHLWNANFAYGYAVAAPNSQGKVGAVVHYGGGQIYPSHAVGTLDPAVGSTPAKWDLLTTINGKFGPADNKWGDYQAVTPHGNDATTWVATGFTLQSGPLATDIQVRYLQFRK